MELIRIADDFSSFVARVLGRDTPGALPAHDWLVVDWEIESEFVSGATRQWLVPQDLDDWSKVVDALAAGRDARWMHVSGRTPELALTFPEPGRHLLEVTVSDPTASRAVVALAIDVSEGWVESLRSSLSRVREVFPQETIETSPGTYAWRDGSPPG